MLSDAVLITILLISLYTDIKYRKIHNSVLLPAVLLGFLINGYEQGWQQGFWFTGKGLLVGVGVFLIPFFFGGLGAGDVKLLGAIGAIKGTQFVLHSALLTAVTGGLIACFILLKQKRFLAALKNIGTSFYTLILMKNVKSLKTLDQAEYHEALPYGVAITIGTLLALLLG